MLLITRSAPSRVISNIPLTRRDACSRPARLGRCRSRAISNTRSASSATTDHLPPGATHARHDQPHRRPPRDRHPPPRQRPRSPPPRPPLGHRPRPRWTPDALLAVLDNPHDRANPTLLAALVRRSQAGDQDAAVLTLAALRRGLWTVVHRYHDHDDAAFDDVLANAALVIARIDPDLDRLYHRIIGRVRAATCEHTDRPEDLVAEHPDRAGPDDDPVIDAVQARLTLRRLAELANNLDVPRDAWHALLASRIDGQPANTLAGDRSPEHLRADNSRLARRLSRLLVA